MTGRSPEWVGKTSGVDALQVVDRRPRVLSRGLLILLLLALPVTAGCHKTSLRVGIGGNGIGQETVQQYYLFFGLVRLNEVDTQRVIGDYTSYDVEVGFSNRDTFFETVGDLLVSLLFLPLTVTRQAVTVKY